MGYRRVRLAGALSPAAGVAIVAASLASHSFSRANAGEKATDLVRPELSSEGLRRHRADFELAKGAVLALYRGAVPAIAAALGQDSASLRADLTRRYPSLARYATDEQLAADLAFAERIIANLERQGEDYLQADRIPLGPLPMTAGPWIAVGTGAVLAATGLGLIALPGRRGLVAILILGVVLVAGPFASGFHQRAHAGKRVLDSLTVTPEGVAETREIFDNAAAALVDLDERVFPDLATRLGVSTAEFDRMVGERHPAIAAGRAAYREVMRRYEARVRIRENGSALIVEAMRYPLDRVTLWCVVPGAVLVAASGLALLRPRRPTKKDSGRDRADAAHAGGGAMIA